MSLSGFSYAWRNGDFSRYMLNTAIVTVTVVVVSTVIAVMAGYSVALAKPPGARWVLYASVFGFMLPVEALIVPWYYQFSSFNIVNTYWSMILPQAAQSIAFGTFWMYVAFRSVPRVAVRERPPGRRLVDCPCCGGSWCPTWPRR